MVVAVEWFKSSRVQQADQDITVQVNNSNRVSAPNDLQVARRRLRICKVEMRERGHSGKLCSIVKFSHGELIIGDRSIKSPLKSSGVSSVSRFP